MITKTDHLVDCHARLAAFFGAQDPPVRCEESRVYEIDQENLPLVAVYAPDEDAQPFAAGTPQFFHTITLAIEIRVATASSWRAAADSLALQALSVLFTSSDWLKRWKETPGWRTRQFIDGAGDREHGGIVITISATARQALQFTLPTPAEISGADLKIDLEVHGDPSTPDGDPELERTIPKPEE